MNTMPTTTDVLRATAVATSAAAMVLVPTLGPVLAGTEEGARDYDTEITPPDYAFAILGPIFASIAANAAQHVARPGAEANRRTGWWLAGAYGANTLWSLAAQTGRFRYTSAILPVAAGLAGCAYQRLQQGEPRTVASTSTGLLLGWTSVASVVNVFATRRRGRLAPTTATGRGAATVAVLGAAAGLAAVVAGSRRGYLPIAAASGWALVTSALNTRRPRTTRAANALGASLIAAAAVVRFKSGDLQLGQRDVVLSGVDVAVS